MTDLNLNEMEAAALAYPAHIKPTVLALIARVRELEAAQHEMVGIGWVRAHVSLAGAPRYTLIQEPEVVAAWYEEEGVALPRAFARVEVVEPYLEMLKGNLQQKIDAQKSGKDTA